jgi:hypothetical protein
MTQPKSLTQNQMDIINMLDAGGWESVITSFAGLTKEQIFTRLENEDTERDNMRLANYLFKELPRFLDAHQAAAISGLSPTTVRNKCPSGQIPGAFKKDYRWLIPAAAVRDLKRNPSRWDNPEWQYPQTENAHRCKKRSYKDNRFNMTQSISLTQNQMDILNLLGADDWESVITSFAGLTKEQISPRLENEDLARDNMNLTNLLFAELPRYLNVRQAAAISGLAIITVCKKCPAGLFPGAFKKGNRWIIPATAARNLKRRPSKWDKPEWQNPSMENAIDNVSDRKQKTRK